jgi:hypothetical protein
MFNPLLATPLPLSVTRAVKLGVPAAVGVPAITPAKLSASPAGREPALKFHE